MKLYAEVRDSQIIQVAWFAVSKKGWYLIEREPLETEKLVYDTGKDIVLIVSPAPPTPEELEIERAAKVKQRLLDEFPDLVLQNKDNPGQLVAALCDRAKAIEVETP